MDSITSVTQNRAITGIWTDYGTGRTSLLRDADTVDRLVAFSAIWLALSMKYIKKIMANAALWIHLWWHKPRPRDINDAPATERDALLSGQRTTLCSREAQTLAQIYKDNPDVRDYFWLFWTNQDLTWGYRLCLLSFTVVLLLTALGLIVGGVFSAAMKSDGPARLASGSCGLWMFDERSGGPEAATRAGVLDLAKETRSAQYAENCYKMSSTFSASNCNFFYRQQLPFSQAKYTTDCPFQDQICRANQTVTFVTDLLDANDIGINTPTGPKFRRNTKCTPLSMEYPFIQNFTENGTTTYYYYYGEKKDGKEAVEHTYKTVGDPWDRLAPVYDVFAYVTNSTPYTNTYWKPRSELTYDKTSTLTIIFVSSLRVLYEKRSDDPIFPADKEYFLPGGSKPWFRNSDPRARPFACINSIEVCLADGTTCWPFVGGKSPEETVPKGTIPPSFWLMYASLLNTDIIDSIAKRLGGALRAQKLVSQYFSPALSDYHWVDEVEGIVATAHARTQINAWSISAGEDSIHEGKDGYTLRTPPKQYGDFCRIFKYNPRGYASIHLGAFITICCMMPVLFILSCEWILITAPFKKVVVQLRANQPRRREDNDRVAVPRTDTGRDRNGEGQTAAQGPQTQNSQPLDTSDEGPQEEASTARNMTPENVSDNPTQQHSDRATASTRPSSEGHPNSVNNIDQVKWEPLVISKILEWLYLFLCYGIWRPIARLLKTCSRGCGL